MAGEQITGVSDAHYDIVSTLYHALQSAETCNKYIKDAKDEGDEEVMKFFHEVQRHSRDVADKAKKLLAKRVM